MTNVHFIQERLLIRGWRAIDRRLNRADIQSICLLVLVVYSIILSISFATQTNGRTVFGPQLGADFGLFYIAGTIFNTQTPDRIYDRNLQRELYRKHFPEEPPGTELPYVNAPFFILPFPLLAQLPYPWAYFVWLLLSLGLYVSGFILIWKSLDAIPQYFYLPALLMAVSFMPFLVECLAGGQTSAFGFFCFALAISCERRGYQIISGVILALCLYKPTLLVLVLPMIVVTRRFSTAAGFAIGSLFLGLVSLLVVGWQGCLEYIKMLLFYTNASTSTASGLTSWKYVDLNSFFRLLFNNHVYLRWILTGLIFILALPMIFNSWWKANRGSEPDQSLVWAFTLSWTLVLNIYLGIYDTSLVVISVLLMTNVFYRCASNSQFELPRTYKLILLLLYLVPWVTQPMAKLTGIQPFTLVLAWFGCYQLFHFVNRGSSSTASPMSASQRFYRLPS
jgi:hypothetical protein